MSDTVVLDGDMELDVPINGEVGSVIGIKGDKGDKGDTGPQGPQGADYVLTSADKAEIAGIVSADFTTETWTFTLDDDSTVIKKVVVES